MLERAVDPAVGDEAEEVQPSARVLGGLQRCRDHGVFQEGSVDDRVVDARDVHHRDPSGAEVQVADFAISHLPDGETDVRTAGADEAVRELRVQGIERRRLRQADGVVGALRALAEAIENDEDQRAGDRQDSGHGVRPR